MSGSDNLNAGFDVLTQRVKFLGLENLVQKTRELIREIEENQPTLLTISIRILDYCEIYDLYF